MSTRNSIFYIFKCTEVFEFYPTEGISSQQRKYVSDINGTGQAEYGDL